MSNFRNPHTPEARAVDAANGELNDVGLPNVHRLAELLKELLEYSDNLRGSAVHARCSAAVGLIEPHLASNI
jgi:hypothetical protein